MCYFNFHLSLFGKLPFYPWLEWVEPNPKPGSGSSRVNRPSHTRSLLSLVLPDPVLFSHLAPHVASAVAGWFWPTPASSAAVLRRNRCAPPPSPILPRLFTSPSLMRLRSTQTRTRVLVSLPCSGCSGVLPWLGAGFTPVPPWWWWWCLLHPWPSSIDHTGTAPSSWRYGLGRW